MAIKTITFKNLIEEINKLGFSEEDRVVLLADENIVTIKKIIPQGHSTFSSQYRSDENKFRDFASPIWEEAKKDNLTPQDIDEIIHRIRKAGKN